jgi:hypothetical protein
VPELPRDWTQLFDAQLYALDMRHVPEAVSTSHGSLWQLGVVQQMALGGGEGAFYALAANAVVQQQARGMCCIGSDGKRCGMWR